MTEEIIFEEIPGKNSLIGLMTLNRPKVLNALNHTMFLSLNQQLTAWEKNDDIKVVVIRATEGRAFCAGGDIRHAYERGKAGDVNLPHFFRDEYYLNRRIFHYPKPYIALLDGITMGGGAGISINGGHRVATENLTFAMPETGIGFFPDVGGSYFLSRLPSKIGFYLGLTGVRIAAADCMALGLVNYYVKQDALPTLISALTEVDFANNADKVAAKIISQFSAAPGESDLFKQRQKIENFFGLKTMEEIHHALEADASEWSQQTANLIKTKSPTSLKVTLRALQEGLNLDFDACMQMEYRLTTHFLQGLDFYEGVRAAIIDKDQSPDWHPARLEDVTAQDVSKYFAPLAEELG